MKKHILILFALAATILSINAMAITEDPCKPTQIHTALSHAYTSDSQLSSSPLKIIFHTSQACPGAHIKVATPSGQKIHVNSTTVDNFSTKYEGTPYSTFIHVFDLPVLPFEQAYHYTCFSNAQNGDPTGPFEFYLTSPTATKNTTTVLMYGDMGYGSRTYKMVETITNLAKNNFSKIAAVIHYGDIAYTLEAEGGKHGDKFMNGIQPIAARLPYMILPGNHEVRQNFTNVAMRFRMPRHEASKNHLFSYNIGKIHFVHFSFDLLSVYNDLLNITTDFLRQDLKEANANRAHRPWIVVTSHRPIWLAGMPSYENRQFDASQNPDDCIPECHIPAYIYSAIEKILYEHKIDIYIAGHIHHYERMFPLYRKKIMPYKKHAGDARHHYIEDPQGPVHILQGSPIAGVVADDTSYPAKGIAAAKGLVSSFAALHAINGTHLHFENIISETGQVSDFMYLIKKKPTSLNIKTFI
jgi:hypothetical protein